MEAIDFIIIWFIVMGVAQLLYLLNIDRQERDSMSDYCALCETRRPEGGTNHFVLKNDDGRVWIEFCEPCGKEEILTNEEGEEKSVYDIFWEGIAEQDKNNA